MTAERRPRPDLASSRNELGATAIEYALMASLVAVATVGTVTLLGTAVIGLFSSMPAGL